MTQGIVYAIFAFLPRQAEQGGREHQLLQTGELAFSKEKALKLDQLV
jgi:hypothetical protein